MTTGSGITRALVAFGAIILMAGCRTVSVHDHHTPASLESAVHASHSVVIRRRRQAASMSLADKAAYFEQRVVRKMPPGVALVPRSYAPSPGTLGHLEMSAHLLSALAFKYAVTKEPQTAELAARMVAGIIAMDRADGFDGYVPRVVVVRRKGLKTAAVTTHANAYVQLFFAYLVAYDLIGIERLRTLVRTHLRAIAKHLLQHDFVLQNGAGETMPFSDMSPGGWRLQRSQRLRLLVFLDVFAHCLPADDAVGQEVLRYRKEVLRKYDYERTIQRLQVSPLGMKWPTASSDWLNLMGLYCGIRTTGAAYCRTAFETLFRGCANQRNPFFSLLYLTAAKPKRTEAAELEADAVWYLSTFPLELDDREIINSVDGGIICRPGPYVKLRRVQESIAPLPVYRRPLTSYEWKRNQLRVDGNFGRRGEVSFTGVDFLQAYWLLRYYQQTMKRHL